MASFKKFRDQINQQFKMLSKQELFTVDVDKDLLWSTYLSSYPAECNPIYNTRHEYDCSCCRQFIKTIGSVVAIKDNKLVSVWDVDAEGEFKIVANNLSNLVKSHKIQNAFRHFENSVGRDHNLFKQNDGKVVQFDHFVVNLPTTLTMKKDRIATFLGEKAANKQVLERSLNELTLEAGNVVLDLIAQNSLYRGVEHRQTVNQFVSMKKEFETVENKDAYLWEKSVLLGGSSKIKNTVIGTLLSDISSDVDLEDAVKMFESKVAPHNYKRPTSLVTPAMVKKAQQTVEDLGIEQSLYRRYAVTEDITINNVLFADRSAKQVMTGVFDQLTKETVKKSPKLDTVEEVTIEKFIESILPNIDSMEVLFENNHVNNLVSVIAPKDKSAPNILKWNNNFTWSYNGEVADSIKERVKKAGGNVQGDVRASLSWYNYDDLDLHAVEPGGNEIYFRSKTSYTTGGTLDVDMNAGGGSTRTPVENIVWANSKKMREGKYKIFVDNFCKRETTNVGFVVEMEVKGQLYNFVYEKPVRGQEKVTVVEFNYTHKDGVVITNSLPHTKSSVEAWGIKTQEFHKVKMMMNSPNHWDDNEVGNKHWFFILDNCINQEQSRGFYNEFLSNSLTEHRKVFELLGAKLKVEHSSNQLSGLGFSSTQPATLTCRVKGSFNRTLKIVF